jgi:hypothetical protein
MPIYEKAFKLIYRGYKHDPKNTDLAGAMAQMGRAADAKMNEEPGCESYRWALSITAPDSRTHKKAEDAARKANCPP